MNTTKTTIAMACLFFLSAFPGMGQTSMPEILNEGTLEQQYEYLHDRTRIYNNFRAIREDMFQKIRTNSLDSLDAVKADLQQLETRFREANGTIQSQQADLQETNEKLNLAIKNRDSLSFLGIQMHKALYNSIVWIIIAALAFLAGVLFLSNKRLMTTARRNRKDLEETREEFEVHRKQSREKYEQMVVKHHNEIRKLKGT
jgi:predicted  nucleic acid-binding Zn-ribbon protein